jgi:hypothetical protein
MNSLKAIVTCFLAALPAILQAEPWVTYEPPAGKSNGKNIVLLSGDEEYRSEESLPQLGKILSQRHGFTCTVLFSQDADGTINPNNQTNIPGMQLLDKADLVICQFRFRELPDADMKHFVDYMEAGKPMMVLRTATHAFHYTRDPKGPFAKYGFAAQGGGFGGMTVGESWTYHHGDHGHEGTRGLIEGKNKSHPILTGVKDIFGLTDVYGVNPDFPADATVLVQGVVLKGMNPDDAPNLNKAEMPIVWLRDYKTTTGKTGKYLGSTIGAAIDLKSEDLRKLFVNSAYWLTDQKVPASVDVAPIGEFTPSMFGFDKFKRGVKVSEHELKP